MMLVHPELAACNDRSRRARKPASGLGPEEWFSHDLLAGHGYKVTDCDFFVEWNDQPVLNRNVWKMALIRSPYDLDNVRPNIDKEVRKWYGDKRLADDLHFYQRMDLDFHLLIFVDDQNWDENAPLLLVKPRFHQLKWRFTHTKISLDDLKSLIRQYSGGSVHVGRKGLNFAHSRLECALSKTDSAYPGDVDALLLDGDNLPVAILEYKKHNLESPIDRQRLARYYPRPDKRKYDRIAVLRDHLESQSGCHLPIFNIYYPTKSSIQQGKVELVTGRAGALKASGHTYFNLPKDRHELHFPFQAIIRGMERHRELLQ